MASVDVQRFRDNASGNGDKCKCNPCSNSGLLKEADKFCRECDEYMCGLCAGIHKSFKAFRNHTVVFCGENSFIHMKVASSSSINVHVPVGAITGSRITRDGRLIHAHYRRLITGSTITPDDRLVLADYRQQKIILLDMNFTIQSSLTLQGEPWDLAADGDNDVIVSLGSSKRLQCIHVDGGLRAGRTVTTSDSCWGVAVHSGHIYISVWPAQHPDRGHVEVLTRDGSVVRRIGVDESGLGTFNYPYYITVGASGTMYVAEPTRINCFSSTDGKVYAVTHNMRRSGGMVADDDGNLLVCCEQSNNVLVLAKDGSHNRTILTSADGLATPQSMAYRRSDGTLIVTMERPPYCRAYKLKCVSDWRNGAYGISDQSSF